MLDRMLLAAGGEEKLYVEDVFSTYLYTGTGTTPQTITNGIDLAGKGGAVWVKGRDTAGYNNWISGDGNNNGLLCTNTTSAAIAGANAASSWQYTSTGMNILSSVFSGAGASVNGSGKTFTSWTFRKAPKFFDVVTYTGNGTFKRVLNHSLGVAPGFIVVKRTDTTSNWWTWHRGGSGAFKNGYLNDIPEFNESGYVSQGNIISGENPALVFDVFNASAVGYPDDDLNVSGATYVAYLFAHDATADGIIQCGSYTGTGTTNTITLGWEPQWVMIKAAQTSGNWIVVDTMRGLTDNTNDRELFPNSAASEFTPSSSRVQVHSQGFRLTDAASSAPNASGINYVYIAIRRGPMKTPTVGTSVFAPVARTGTSTFTPVSISAGFTPDLYFNKDRNATQFGSPFWYDRLRGKDARLISSSTSAEGAVTTDLTSFDMNGITTGTSSTLNYTGVAYINYFFKRAPGFFDEVCYTGTGVARTVNHNLGVAPELMIIKIRNSINIWRVYYNPNSTLYLDRNTSGATASSVVWNNTDPTATVFSVGTDSSVNGSGSTYVNYLFASCPGVSKIGSYTGNGSSQTINCGFSNGARFFLVKRTDSTGDWWVYDSARGIVAAADPALRLNSTAAEVTSADAVDTDSTGIIVNQEATCNINVNGGTYIYLAIA